MAVIELRTAPVQRPDADAALEALYAAHWQPLVRLSVLLVSDLSTAEEVVEDAFVAMHQRWHRLRDTEKALAYLRKTVASRSRAGARHRRARPDLAGAPPQLVLGAIQALPQRQREVVALRCYLQLSEADIADTLGIRRRSVRRHASEGMAALSAVSAGRSRTA
ncbi:RNA polymerase subunit sigma-24 [Nocardioides phosphati]|uniref:RNA polymerase subunit sigma-24 n=1 Tax=Nocardioides phosphati TaxID=1867775 RepID=A0ABQ2NB14_9ACTN|nr:sigma factor-like helix-turn-helix DNA-binding protein [Nocardioides phosphati]GGO91128.1 RNA polymerase subunit sigma-24 [Nocardioides phosphati]